jgi:DNA-directed RNA polymerase subunit RPC12/RpoP
MDYDYFKTLSPKERAKKKKHSLNFTCPYCLTKENVTSRKQKLTSGFLFWTEDYLVDIFKCGRCGKEFSEDELQREINRFKRENYIIENFENWRDAKKKGENPPEFYSLDKADEMIITDFKHHPIRESK